jgi:hypothetical protein
MKIKYVLIVSRKTVARYASEELGAARAATELRANPGTIPCASMFGASNDGSFKTRKSAENFARRIEMMSAFVAGKLGKSDYESVRVIAV